MSLLCSKCKTREVDVSGMSDDEIQNTDYPPICDDCFEEELFNYTNDEMLKESKENQHLT